ncbi:MAG: hypothetical protein JW807_08705 [Spirochaetes bacterium]|nr:hypothetical protein [Spirochaetota bacterium]
MKITTAKVSAIVFFICVMVGGSADSKPKERVLVLGFNSVLLNDVQDRLLRETVLREFHTRGFRIVPVMEIESLLFEDQKRQIRRLGRDEIRNICDELRAGLACSGLIVPEDGRVDNEIREGKNYLCTCTWYRRSDNRFSEIKLRVAGGKGLFRFFSSLAKMIVDEAEKLN